MGVQQGLRGAAALASGEATEAHPLRRMLRECSQLGDNPWWLLAPLLLREYPAALFILSGLGSGGGPSDWEAGCAAWANSSAREFWACATPPYALDDIHACWAGTRFFDAAIFARRCVQHYRDVTDAAHKVGRRLLQLPTDLDDESKWAALDAFLGTTPAAIAKRRTAHGRAFPHVRSVSSKRGCNWTAARPRRRRSGR